MTDFDSAFFPSSTAASRRQFLQAAAAGSVVLTLGAQASTYPQQTVRIVVPFAAGAGTDAMGRLLAQKLAEVLGGSVVVENRTGASGAIGSQFVAQSAADGHTLLLVAAPFTTVPAVLPSAGYDPVGSFAPISMVAQGPLLWASNKDLPVNNLAELITYAKTRPGQLNYGSAGAGGINHLVLEQLKARKGISIVHIPYRGIAPAITDLIGGQTQMMFPGLAAALPHIRSGRIRALAVTGTKRHPQVKDIPTLEEAGLKGFDAQQWYGVVGPANMPAPIVKVLNDAMLNVLSQPDFKEKLSSEAVELMPMKPAEFAAYMKADLARWTQLAKARNIQLDS